MRRAYGPDMRRCLRQLAAHAVDDEAPFLEEEADEPDPGTAAAYREFDAEVTRALEVK